MVSEYMFFFTPQSKKEHSRAKIRGMSKCYDISLLAKNTTDRSIAEKYQGERQATSRSCARPRNSCQPIRGRIVGKRCADACFIPRVET
jgi:hypothetical protein